MNPTVWRNHLTHVRTGGENMRWRGVGGHPTKPRSENRRKLLNRQTIIDGEMHACQTETKGG